MRSTATLDQVELRINFISAINRQIKLRRLIQRRQRNTKTLGLQTSGLGGGNANELQHFSLHTLSQKIDEYLGRRTGT